MEGNCNQKSVQKLFVLFILERMFLIYTKSNKASRNGKSQF